jgi:hypothetical protein
MSRMAQHWQDQQDEEREQHINDQERYEYEQGLLAADPAYLDWLDSINARNQQEREDADSHD